MTDDDPLDEFDSDETPGADPAHYEDLDPADDSDDGDDGGGRLGGAQETLSGVRDGAATVGAGIGKILILPPKLTWLTLEGVALGITRPLPGGSKFWQKWIKIGYGNLKRASGADRINHVMKQGHIIHRPIYWNSEHDRWETKNGNNWWNGGKQHTYLGPGNTPCAWAASEATELGNQVQAEVAEALDIGAGASLYTDAKVTIDNVTLSMGQQGAGSGQAMADGGRSQTLTSYVNVDNPGVLEDYVIDLHELFVDDEGNVADGRLVSMEKYYQTYPETVDSEEMQKQEDRGILAAMKDGNAWKKALYMMIAAFVFVLAWEYAPALLGMAGGAAGGGGGGIVPF